MVDSNQYILTMHLISSYLPFLLLYLYLQMATRQDVINWVSRAWESVSVETIKHSFKVTGISADLDGSEDHLLNDRMAVALNEADRLRVEAGEQALNMLFNEEGSDSELEFEGFGDDD